MTTKMLKSKALLVFGPLLTAALMFAVGCSKKLKPENSCNFVQNEDRQRVSWSQAPIRLMIHESVKPEYYQAVKTAVLFWNSGYKKKLFEIEAFGVTSPTKAGRDGVSMIFWRSKWDSSSAREHARTTIFWVGKNIVEADMEINDEHYDFFTGETPDFTKVHLESLLIHELGHVLGLAHNGETHSEEPDSVMNVQLAKGYLRDTQEQAEKDFESLRCEY